MILVSGERTGKRFTLSCSRSPSPTLEGYTMSKIKNVVKSKPAAVVVASKKSKGGKFALLTHANGADFSETRPGVISTIVTLLCAGPISKPALLATLVKRFPARGEDKMKATLAMQVPSGLHIEKGYVVVTQETDKGKLYSLDAKKLAGWDSARKIAREAGKK